MKIATLPLVVLLALVSWASGITEGDWTYIVEDGGASITGSTATGDVRIPSGLGGYPVTSIGNGAFYGSLGLTSVIIPNSVTSIGFQAFSYCTGLTSVSIGNGVTSIAQEAFYDCTGLTGVNIPDSVTSIGASAFYGCTGLTSVSIGNNVLLTVGANAFAKCPLVGTITLPLLSTVGASAFPNGVTITRSSESLADSLVEAIARRVVTAAPISNYGIATKADLSGAITDAITTATSTLATKAEITTAINEGKASGIASVTAAPNTWSLFTTSQIQNMAVGDLVLTRQVGGDGDFVLNYDIEQSEDLVNWTPYQALSLPLTGLPTDKAFIRIRAK